MNEDELKQIIHLKVEMEFKYLDKMCPNLRVDQMKRDMEELILEILKEYL